MVSGGFQVKMSESWPSTSYVDMCLVVEPQCFQCLRFLKIWATMWPGCQMGSFEMAGERRPIPGLQAVSLHGWWLCLSQMPLRRIPRSSLGFCLRGTQVLFHKSLSSIPMPRSCLCQKRWRFCTADTVEILKSWILKRCFLVSSTIYDILQTLATCFEETDMPQEHRIAGSLIPHKRCRSNVWPGPLCSHQAPQPRLFVVYGDGEVRCGFLSSGQVKERRKTSKKIIQEKH